MWRCRITGGDVNGYRAFAKIFDNIIGFLLGNERSARNYAELLEENRSLFLEAIEKDSDYAELVEPRELLFLLHQLEMCESLSYVTRPHKRKCKISERFLIFCQENSTMVCLFCGFSGPVTSDIYTGEPRRSAMISRTCSCANTIRNESAPDQPPGNERTSQRERGGGVTTVFYHFHKCPLVWLDGNCEWVRKHTKVLSREWSKFGSALETLYRSRGRAMSTESEWNEFIKLTTIEHIQSMGACEDTLLRLYRKLAETKLERVEPEYDIEGCPLLTIPAVSHLVHCISSPNLCEPLGAPPPAMRMKRLDGAMSIEPRFSSFLEYHKTSRQKIDYRIPLNPLLIRNDADPTFEQEQFAYWFYRTKKLESVCHRESLNAAAYEKHLLSSSGVPTTDNYVNPDSNFYAIPLEIAHRAFFMHGFCVNKTGGPQGHDFYDMNKEFRLRNDSFIEHAKRTLFKKSSFHVLCIFCGYSFTSRLCDPALVDRMYDEKERKIIEDYLLGGSPIDFAAADPATTDRWVWWSRKPGRYRTLALTPFEVLTAGAKKMKQIDVPTTTTTTTGRTAVWLSASLNSSHAYTCIFRIKKRDWVTENCPICLTGGQRLNVAFNCGHALCDTCANDVRLTNCPVCRHGVRKHRITINNEMFV